jgi:hypothetical protein
MAILFVASESFELKPFAGRLTGLRPLKWPVQYAEEGVWQGKRYLLAANGAGPKLAARCVEMALRATAMAELSSSRLEAVVSVGLCGGLISDLKVGDIVEATEILDPGLGGRFPCQSVQHDGNVLRGPLASVDRVAVTQTAKRELATTGAIAVDMEAAGVAQHTLAAGLPCCCIKAVSDVANEDFVIDFNKHRTTHGRLSRGKIVLYAVMHPGVIPKLLTIKRQSERAASALGVFLASCRFQFGDHFPGPEAAQS